MCGILGTTKMVDKQCFDKALFKLNHRGPDGLNSYCCNGIWLGHARLSVLDLSDRGNQPMATSDGQVVITYNGEIYNYKDLRSNLEKQGCIFKSQTDTEVILEGYKIYGVDFFANLRGMWAFVIYDARKGKMVFSRDSFGIKPLYYSIANGIFSFASELTPLSDFLETFVPDDQAYEQYYILGSMVAPLSGVKDVFQVLPGQILTYDVVKKELLSASLPSSKLPKKEKTELIDDQVSFIDSELSDSIASHFVSDVPVGILLSGGTDSSLIAALSKKLNFNPKCYHVAIDGSIDTGYAESIAKKLDLNLNILTFSEKEMQNTYNEVLDHIDIPLSDISLLPTSLVFKEVAKHAKVVLSGEGGDELFGGYLRHLTLRAGQYGHDSVSIASWIKASYPTMRYAYPVFSRLQNIIDVLMKDISGLYIDQAAVIYQPNQYNDTKKYLKSFIQNHSIAKSIPPSLFFDLILYLPNILLVKNDRMSMMHSVEARVPFLDKNFFYAAQSLDISQRQPTKNQNKEILKKVLSKYLPEELVYRGKKGFGFSKDMLLSEKIIQDFYNAVKFHESNSTLFAWDRLNLPKSNNQKFYRLLIKKYPRFAFGLISSHAVWKKYGY